MTRFTNAMLFDDVIAPEATGPRERFTAVARSVRDVLSQRWVRTEATYQREDPKRIYYLSMEFLIGRSLSNNIINLLLDPIARQTAEHLNLDWLGLIEQEPDAGLGNGGLGRLAACFLDSLATMLLAAMGSGLRYSTSKGIGEDLAVDPELGPLIRRATERKALPRGSRRLNIPL
jgi:glycogen phosphorylase